MAKPYGYEDMDDDEKHELMRGLFMPEHDGRGMLLLNRAFEMSGTERPEISSPDFNRLACRALEAAIGGLTMKEKPDWSNIQDMEMILEGLQIQERSGKS